MEHAHHHHHHHHAPLETNLNRAFVLGIGLNLGFVLVEAGAGYYYDSLALYSDAGHNLSDVVSLILAMIAFRLAKLPATTTFTYGYRKTTILVSLVNAVVLLAAMAIIAWESVHRLQTPRNVNGEGVALVAGVGIVINTFTAWLFFKDRKNDLNVKGAYLHMAADALVSMGVVLAGILIYYTGWYWLDVVVSLLIVVVVVISTWSLLRDSLILTLDGVPNGIDLEEIESTIRQFELVQEVSHLHVWAMSTTQNALTVHITLREPFGLSDFFSVKESIKHELEHLSIQHSTIEVELPGTAKDCY
ncbi:cation diffusion facilitator family transporter [Arundinibacter roseus]|uniref:Cation transporter n=1 Tax=Arundinibacter roseus TaxID=2070510 RepID=A0A4R4JU50_9BACT|nr:cation diffusion facilitator family transporter [Arundinibacter roseus]TDB57351.1 cation transporter [Arundinibacter roseus]